MTGPMPPEMQGGPPVPQSGYYPSPNAGQQASLEQQLNQFNAQRDQQIQAALQKLGVIQQPGPTSATLHQGPVPSADWSDDDLLGAAKFWGIPQEAATAMPRDHLVQILTQMRTAARPADQESSSLMNAGIAASMFGVGAGEAVTQGLRNLPLVGEALGRIDALHKTDIYFKSLEEGLRSSAPQSIQPVLTGEKWLGNLATLAYPGTVAWKAAGAFPLVGKMTPIVRGAVQGAGSAYLLEGGSKEFQDNPSGTLGMGAGLGIAFPIASAAWKKLAPMIGAVQNKVVSAFVPQPPASAASAAPVSAELGVELQQPPATTLAGGESLAHPEGFVPSTGLGATDGPLPPLPSGFEIGPPPSSVAPTQRFPSGVSAQGASIQLPYSEQFQNPISREAVASARLPQGFTSEAAVANASGLSKAAIVLDSPDLPKIAGATQLTDATVAQAAQATNPGGSNLIQGVSDPAAFMQQTEGHVAFVTPKGSQRLDAIVSDEPVTGAMISDYQTHGAYAGQQAYTKAGVEGTIQRINAAAQAIFRPTHGGIEFLTPVSELSPGAVSPATTETPLLWKQLQGYVDEKASAFTQQLSGPLATEEQLALVKTQNMQHYTDEFLTKMGITGEGERARLTSYFNAQYVESYKMQALAEVAGAEQLATRAQSVQAETTPLQTLDAAASVKGFTVIPEADGGVTLQDRIPPQGGAASTEVRMASHEAAQDWLRQYGERTLPDATPKVDIPLEVMPLQPVSTGQPMNVNGTQEQGMLNELHSMSEGEAEDPSYKVWAQGLHEQASKLVGTGQLGQLQNIYMNGLTNWSGMRKLFASMDEFASQAGLYEKGLRPFEDYSKISTAVNQNNNLKTPWQQRWSEISQEITPANKRSGLWTQAYLNPDPAARLVQARAAGLNPREIAAFDKMPAFWQDLFKETGLDAAREIPQYMPLLQKMQSTGDFAGMDSWQGVSPFHTAFFEQVRRNAVNVREMDPDVLVNAYINSWGWQKAMDAPFSEVAQRWNAVAQQAPELAPAATITKNWLQQIRYGYQEGNDPALDAAHLMAQTFLGPNVTKQQARGLVNGALNWSYKSLMGYRVDLVARDLQQVWMALPRAGPKLLGTMQEFASGSTEARAAMWKEALDDNIISLQHQRSSSPGTFGATDDQAALSTLPNTATQNALNSINDTLGAMRPAWMNDPRLSPSYLYGLQGESVRMFSGIAGKRVAQEAISDFRAAGSQNMEGLLADSKAATYYPAVQRQFQQLIGSGQDGEAAAFLGRQLADASQFKYGAAETPINMRTVTGRLGLQLGSYPMQYLQFLGESLQNGSVADKVKLAATMSAVSAGFYSASQATGWNFNRMNPFTGVGFAGGPVMAQAEELAKGVSGGIDAVTGATRGGGGGTTPSLGQMAGSTAALFNPAGGLLRTGEGLANALQSPTPGVATLRVGLTGEASNASDINRELLPQTDAMFQQSLRPLQSPVNQGRTGTLQIPQQLVTQPLEMGGQGVATPPGTTGAQTNGGQSQQSHYDMAANQLRSQGMPEDSIVHILGARP